MRPDRDFWKTTNTIFIGEKIGNHSKKITLQRVKHGAKEAAKEPQKHKWTSFMGFFCSLCYWVPWKCAWQYEIGWLQVSFRAKCCIECQESASLSKVMDHNRLACVHWRNIKVSGDWLGALRWSMLGYNLISDPLTVLYLFSSFYFLYLIFGGSPCLLWVMQQHKTAE